MSLNNSSKIKVLRKFDVDLEFGKHWEEHVDEVFSGATKCEVKTERDKWASTGNICIEIIVLYLGSVFTNSLITSL